MHPISTRGRSMSRDRQTFRAFFVVLTILGWSLSTGCLRSTILPPADGPAPQPARANGPATSVLAPSAPSVSTQAAGPTTRTMTDLQAAPTPTQDQAALAPLTPQPPPAIPSVTPSAAEAPAANSTPLMDAAIERVAAVTRQQRDSLDSARSAPEPDGHDTTAVAAGSPAAQPMAPVQPTPTPLLVADNSASIPLTAPTLVEPIDSSTQPAISAVPKSETQQIGAEKQPKTEILARVELAASTHETPRTVREDTQQVAANVPSVADLVDPLSIGKLCLCRKILGFGSFEPLSESRVKAGRPILLYCEMTGMQYEPKDASFISRLSSKIEIGSVENGVFQWAHEWDPAEDVCATRRRDFFVNYRFSLPPTLLPGSYRLRLTQTDLIANRSTSTEIPLEIMP